MGITPSRATVFIPLSILSINRQKVSTEKKDCRRKLSLAYAVLFAAHSENQIKFVC